MELNDKWGIKKSFTRKKLEDKASDILETWNKKDLIKVMIYEMSDFQLQDFIKNNS